MNYATAPVATPGGGTAPPVCRNCTTSTTPLWRRDDSGAVLCNACGLFLKLHSRPRPISLKTDVIKSRNRTKNVASRMKRKGPPTSNPIGVVGQSTMTVEDGNMAASSIDVYDHPSKARRLSLKQNQVEGMAHLDGSDRDGRFAGDVQPAFGYLHHHHHVLPRRPVDHPGGMVEGHAVPVAGPPIGYAHPAGMVGSHGRHMSSSSSQPYESLMAAHANLQTRVNELEVINDLFRGRVIELERAEKDAFAVVAEARESERRIRAQLDHALNQLAGLTGQKTSGQTTVLCSSPPNGGGSTKQVNRIADIVNPASPVAQRRRVASVSGPMALPLPFLAQQSPISTSRHCSHPSLGGFSVPNMVGQVRSGRGSINGGPSFGPGDCFPLACSSSDSSMSRYSVQCDVRQSINSSDADIQSRGRPSGLGLGVGVGLHVQAGHLVQSYPTRQMHPTHQMAQTRPTDSTDRNGMRQC